jgi:FMN reductase
MTQGERLSGRAGDLRVVGLLGSTTVPGRLHGAVNGALARLGQRGTAQTAFVDLGDEHVGFADGRPIDALEDDTGRIVQLIRDADAVLLATPVYRGSFTGSLKNLLDLTPVDALEGKPVAIAAMGATPQHFLGADRHLRDVLAFFGALVTPVAVYLTSRDFEDGLATASAADQLDTLLDGLVGLTAATRGAGDLGPRPIGAAAAPVRAP